MSDVSDKDLERLFASVGESFEMTVNLPLDDGKRFYLEGVFIVKRLVDRKTNRYLTADAYKFPDNCPLEGD